MLWVALHFQHLPQGTLEAIAAWACQFTPRVSLEPPRAVLLEVEGSLRLYGGREALERRLRSGLEQMDLGADLASAPTARGALWLACSSRKNLEAVPLEAACNEDESLQFLKSIGIATVGELMRLPRAGLAQRCGPGFIDELDRALGRVPEARVFFEPPPCFEARLELPAPVTHAEALAFAARRLLVQLEGLLAARQAGIRAFRLILVDTQAQRELTVGLASPARDAARMMRLLQEKLAHTVLERPVEAIGLEARNFAPLEGRTGAMFGDAAAEAEDWAALLERLRARLGREAVWGLATHPDHRPEHAWRRVEPGEWDPHEARTPGLRPLWLLHPKILSEGSAFEMLTGPERIESGWWDGDEARRDYFIARLPQGALGWIYREGEHWYLHGLFA